MELRALKSFIVTAEKMNFTKAADQLGYTQATISIHIKQLEKELGTPLFDRIGKNVYLTEKGKDFLVHAQRIMQYTEKSIADMADIQESTGVLRVGTSESILSQIFPEIINNFHKLYPDIHVLIKTDTRDSIFNLLNQNELDFAYTIDQNLIDHNWIGRTTHEDQAFFVASPNHPLVQKKHVTIHEILMQDLAITESDVGYSYALFQLLAKNNLFLKPFLETGNTDLIKQLVSENKAISYLPPYSIKRELANGSIVPIKIPEFEVTVYRQLYWHKNKYLTQPMIDFMNLIEQSMI